ncbi:MAG TPA: replicative DNA helicase [Candidatus Cloacimonadota bacterium]|nr:replicative DNA helicase [Candidatus Cloacimonadota bacterium]HOV16458.1 replicative DNA helicase [Candidatus Cloacimonadota bacterium]HQL14958.1 replicative DNA helicase [Candidatus Cloacimonadota bacterium]
MPKRTVSPPEETKISERVLPSNINAEAAVLSAMLIDKDAADKGIEKLKEEYFYRTAHRLIFRIMQELFNENYEIDAITVINHLERANLLEKVGGIPYINELSNVVVSSANFDYHLNIMLDQAYLRQLIIACNGIIESCYRADKPVKSIIDDAEQAIFAIAEMPKDQGFVRISDISPEVLDAVEKVASTHVPVLGVPSGFADVDKLTGGFRPGQFIVIASRPAMGKSAFGLNIAAHAGVDLGKKIAIFTMEMSREEILMRLFSSASQVPMTTMLRGFGLNDQKMRLIFQAAEAFSKSQIYIDDQGTNTPLELRAKARRLASAIGGLDLIIIDYLQLMTSPKSKDNRQQEISDISRALKVLAKDMKIPVIALAQLNRMLEARDDKRPVLSDLRESGAIEQDADLVMFIYRDEYYVRLQQEKLKKSHSTKYNETDFEDELEKVKGKAEIIIGKNRHGATGVANLRFNAEITKFQNLDIVDDY